MLHRKLVTIVLFALGTNLLIHHTALAAEAQLRAMAEMLAGLNHYPNDSQKTSLQKIVGDTNASAAEHAIANGLLHMQHKVTDEDRAKLKAVINDKGASEQARRLAEVLSNFQHMATEEDKKILSTLAK